MLLISCAEFFFICFLQDEDGNKTVNEFVRQRKIGSGSYGKVVSVTKLYGPGPMA